MSQADDMSLLAMKAARMSTPSIAFTIGWSESRVERRIAALEEQGRAALHAATERATVTGGFSAERLIPPVTPERAPITNPVRTPRPQPAPEPRRIPAGEGLVTRTFALSNRERGAAVLLGDGRMVFTELGPPKFTEDGKRVPDLGAQIFVTQDAGVYRLAESPRG